jgi:hypothetical protein
LAWLPARIGGQRKQRAVESAIYQTKTPEEALGDYSRELDDLLAERVGETGEGSE